jgi:hypothetical protein
MLMRSARTARLEASFDTLPGLNAGVAAQDEDAR